jgi:hypothetical protein
MDSVSIIHNIQDIARLLLPFLFGWTVWYFIKTTEKNNRAINSSLYNHAQHIMAIKELYKKDENKKELTGLIDKNELLGVLSPSKEQTTNNYKTRKKTDELMRKNYPHLFDNNGDKIK